MKNKRQQIADMWQVLADNTEAYFELDYEDGGWDRSSGIPNEQSDLSDWRVHIPPKPHPMEKYIELGLDMHFSDDGLNWKVGKFTGFSAQARKHIKDDKTHFFKCRLRPKHVHWWDGKSVINPIPKNCEYRIYTRNWSVWLEFDSPYFKSNYLDWRKVLAFEIRYLE